MEMSVSSGVPFRFFRKRDGFLVPFQKDKIAKAVLKAGEAAAREEGKPFDPALADQIADDVVAQLNNPLCEYYTVPDANGERVEEFDKLIVTTLLETED